MTPENTKSTMTPASPGEAVAHGDSGQTVLVRSGTAIGALPPPGEGGFQSWVGKKLGKYEIAGVLGQGAMGVVLKAHDPLIDRDVAIKILHGDMAGDPLALDRFLAEARAAGKLNHPNVIAIYEICQEGDMYYLVLEYVPGGSLGDRLDEKKALPLLEATQAMIDACKGVGAAHAAGLIHRDLKPDNLMRAADGSIKVADFGLAKIAAGSRRQFTQTGMVVGTPYFMSPEQCNANRLDQRSDIYSLGATYYTLLTGKSPYEETESVPQLLYMHCHGPLLDPRTVNPGIPDACARIIGRAMAKAPGDRYQTSAEMLADLQTVTAALSGQARIALPSDRGVTPALAPPGRKPAGSRRHGVGRRRSLDPRPGWVGRLLLGARGTNPLPALRPANRSRLASFIP